MDDLVRENEILSKEVKRQTQEVKRQTDHMAAVIKVASTVSQSLDLDQTLTTALEVVTGVIHAEAGGISLIDETTDEVVLRAQLGWDNNFTTPPMRVPVGKGMSGWVIKRDDVLVVHDLHTRNDDIAVQRFKTEERFRSMVMAPMHARGKIIGILSIMSQHPGSFDNAAIELMRVVADTVGVALDNARLYQNSVENENRLSAVLQSTADGIITTDQNGVIRMMNPSAERMLDTQAEDTVNLPLREAPIPSQLRDPLRVALSSRHESPEKSFQIDMPDKRVLLVFVSPVWEGDNTLDPSAQDGWVIVLQDVTLLRQAGEMRAQFIQAAAHDMRNPLGVTLTSLGTLQTYVEDDMMQEVISVALSGVGRMQRLLDDMLNLERIENGYNFNIQEVDITELLHEICVQMRPLIEEKLQTQTIDIAPKMGYIPADSHWISRAIINYFGNANKYTPEGGQITLKAFEKENFVHIEVTDNGPGIPLDVQSRLFERFYQVKGAHIERGSGLGLAIVKSVVEAHGGGVYMRSKVGEGSTFGMALPTKLRGNEQSSNAG